MDVEVGQGCDALCARCTAARIATSGSARQRMLATHALLLEMGAPRSSIVASSHESGRSPGQVYFAEAVGSSRVKIGWTGGKPLFRLREIGTSSPFPLRLLGAVYGTEKTEKWFHHVCRDAHLHGEWFSLEPLRQMIDILQLALPVELTAP